MSGLTSAEASRMRFSSSGKGYDKREVMNFKRLVATGLLVIERNLGEDMPITAENILEKGFSMKIGGLDYEEVDMFLERAQRIISAYEQTRAIPDPHEYESLTSAETTHPGFTVVFRGYNMASVDRYIDRLSETLTAYEQGERFVALDGSEVSRKLFDISMRGYAEQEVDTMLDRAADTLKHYEDLRRRQGGAATKMA